MKCRKGLHEMTEDNTKLDAKSRKHCRACIRERKSGYHKGSAGVGRHNDGTFNRVRTAMDEALAANPPKIVYRKGKGGIYHAIEVRDPHAETTAQLEWDARMAREEEALAAMREEADEVAERFRKHRADNTPLLAAARTI